MPKPSEPTERDWKLARQVDDKKGPTKRVAQAIAQARAEEREAILERVRGLNPLWNDHIDWEDLIDWIEARGKEGGGDAKE